MYEVFVRDSNLHKVGIIGTFNSLELNIKFNDVGTWTLELPDDNPASGLLKQVRSQGGGLGGIIVERDGLPIFSGPIRRVEMNAEWGSEKGAVTLFSGVDDVGILATRLALPSPYTYPTGTGYGWYTDYGKTEDVMVRLVAFNVAELAPGNRRIHGLRSFSSKQRGSNIYIRSRMHPLLEKLKEAALAGGGLGFRCLQKVPGYIDFEIYEPANKTTEVIFSKELGNLVGFKYTVEAPEVNVVVSGGKGDGTGRYFAYNKDEPSRKLYGTIEGFLDQRDSDPAEIDQAIIKELEEKTEKTELEISPIDIYPTRYKIDYDLGDKVAVRVQDDTLYDIVRGVTIKLTQEGDSIVPVIGTPNVGTGFRLLDNYRNLAARVGALERK